MRRKREWRMDREKEKREWQRAEQRPGPRPFIRPSTEWLTGGPKRSKKIPQQSRAQYVAKKVAWGLRGLA